MIIDFTKGQWDGAVGQKAAVTDERYLWNDLMSGRVNTHVPYRYTGKTKA